LPTRDQGLDAAHQGFLENGSLGANQAVLYDTRLDRGAQLIRGTRFGQVAEDLRRVDCGNGGVPSRLAGQQDAGGIRIHRQHMMKESRAIHAGHAHVRDHHGGTSHLLEGFQRLIAAQRGVDIVVFAQVQYEAFDHPGLIVDTQHAGQIGSIHGDPSKDCNVSVTRRSASVQSNGASTEARYVASTPASAGRSALNVVESPGVREWATASAANTSKVDDATLWGT